MTNQIRSLFGLALLLAAVSVTAQAGNVVQVKVPFPFVTAGKSWPAAEYRVQIRVDNHTLTLSSPGIGSATILADIDARPGDGRAYLIFLRSGDRWFLQEVTLDGTAHVLSTGDLEKERVKERLSLEARPATEL
jgi:hypothetical protein